MITYEICHREEIYDALSAFEGVTIYHDRNWHDFLEMAMGFEVQAVVGTRDGRPVVYFPFIRKRRFFRTINVCLPLSHSVGPIWRRGVATENLNLDRSLCPLEIHSTAGGKHLQQSSTHMVTRLTFGDVQSVDDVFMRFHKNAVRSLVVKAEKNSVEVEGNRTPAAFEEFASFQDTTRRRQKAPTYPQVFFPAMERCLGRNRQAKVYLARLRGRAVAGVVFLEYGDTAIYGYGASIPDRELWRIGVNQAAMWGAIQDAFITGKKIVDFGSSPVSQPNLRVYKERFGGRSEPLAHTFMTADNNDLAIAQDGFLSKAGGEVLHRLPLPIFRLVSPVLLKMVL